MKAYGILTASSIALILALCFYQSPRGISSRPARPKIVTAPVVCLGGVCPSGCCPPPAFSGPAVCSFSAHPSPVRLHLHSVSSLCLLRITICTMRNHKKSSRCPFDLSFSSFSSGSQFLTHLGLSRALPGQACRCTAVEFKFSLLFQPLHRPASLLVSSFGLQQVSKAH